LVILRWSACKPNERLSDIMLIDICASRKRRLAGDRPAAWMRLESSVGRTDLRGSWVGQETTPHSMPRHFSLAIPGGVKLTAWDATQHLVSTIDNLHQAGIGFRVLSGQVPASTPPRLQASSGSLRHWLSTSGNLIRERTMITARASGRPF